MTRKLPFFIACAGIIIASLASLMLPIYYTKIIDIVQASSAGRLALVPVLIGILIAMAVIELCNIAGRRMV